MDFRALRSAFGNFVTGVTIVTAIDEAGQPRGLTANSFTSVSLDPPLLLVCIANSSSTRPVFEAADGFSINILSEDQRGLCDAFARRAGDKFAGVDWVAGATGAPRLPGCLAGFDCSVDSRIPAGDHLVLIGQVRAFDMLPGRPLVYGQGGYIPLKVQQAAVTRPVGREAVVSCIAEIDGRVLLERTDAGWTLPQTHLSAGSDGSRPALPEAFRRLDIEVEVTFLYSVFDSSPLGDVHIVYRGEVRRLPAADSETVRAFEEAALPWDDLSPPQIKGMLQRFFRERAIDQFGVYSEFAEYKRVARLSQAIEPFDRYLSRFPKS